MIGIRRRAIARPLVDPRVDDLERRIKILEFVLNQALGLNPQEIADEKGFRP